MSESISIQSVVSRLVSAARPALFAVSLVALSTTAAQASPQEGEPAPGFAGYRQNGQKVDLSTFSGKVVVLSFWASWCGPCRKELPVLEGMQRAGKGRLQVVAVNVESADVYRKISANAQKLEMLMASDAGGETQRLYGVRGIPHMVIIGKDGRVFKVHRGYSDAGVDDAVADLNRALTQ